MSDFIALPAGLSLQGYGAMGVMVLVGACLQGVGGLGFAMFSAPIAALFFPGLVPGPLLALGLPLAVMSGLREFHEIDWTIAGMAVIGRGLGALFGAMLLATVPEKPMAVTFAVMILIGVALSLGGWRVTATRGNMALAGCASGLMGTITSAGAPPLAIAMQSLPGPRLRATLGGIFFAGTLLSLSMLAMVGRFGWAQVGLSLMLLPWVVVGFVASNPIGRRVPGAALRPMLLTLATLGAVGVLVKVVA